MAYIITDIDGIAKTMVDYKEAIDLFDAFADRLNRAEKEKDTKQRSITLLNGQMLLRLTQV